MQSMPTISSVPESNWDAGSAIIASSRMKNILASRYLLGFAIPLAIAPIWAFAWSYTSLAAETLIRTWAGAVTVWLVCVAAYTDTRWLRIPNWLTYPAALIGLFFNLALINFISVEKLGPVGALQSLLGFSVLFFLLFMLFSFTGGGAGDVKLVAGIGSLIGLELGLEAVLISFVFAGLTAVARGIWVHGPIGFATLCLRPIFSYFLPTLVDAPNRSQYDSMHAPLPLGPSFAIGTIMVLCGFRTQMITDWLGI